MSKSQKSRRSSRSKKSKRTSKSKKSRRSSKSKKSKRSKKSKKSGKSRSKSKKKSKRGKTKSRSKSRKGRSKSLLSKSRKSRMSPSRKSEKVIPKETFESGTDPIDFFSTRVLFDKGHKDELENDHLSSATKVPSLARTKDWSKSRCLKLVMELRAQPHEDRIRNFRTLESIYVNPREIDIFTEEEAIYNAHVLRNRFETQHLNELPTEEYELKMYEIDQKARRSIQVLSNFLLLSKHSHKDIIDLLRDEQLFIATTEIESKSYKDNMAVATKTVKALHYQNNVPVLESIPETLDHNPQAIAITDNLESPIKPTISKSLGLDIDHNNVIKLLLRVRNLYQALSEVMHILELILQQREMFTNHESILNQTVKEYLGRIKEGKGKGALGPRDAVIPTEKILIKG